MRKKTVVNQCQTDGKQILNGWQMIIKRTADGQDFEWQMDGKQRVKWEPDWKQQTDSKWMANRQQMDIKQTPKRWKTGAKGTPIRLLTDGLQLTNR